MRLFSKRIYTSGSKFAVFRWTLTHSGYLTRFFLLHRSGWGGVALHWLNKPDPEPYLHDHPVNMFTLLLRGWYKEEIAVKDLQSCSPFINRVRFFNYLPFYKRHTICEVAPGGALTLAFYGPHRNDWGFYLPSGWKYWKEYNAERYESTIAKPLPVEWPTPSSTQIAPGKDLFL